MTVKLLFKPMISLIALSTCDATLAFPMLSRQVQG